MLKDASMWPSRSSTDPACSSECEHGALVWPSVHASAGVQLPDSAYNPRCRRRRNTDGQSLASYLNSQGAEEMDGQPRNEQKKKRKRRRAPVKEPPIFPVLETALVNWIYYRQFIRQRVALWQMRNRVDCYSKLLHLGIERKVFSKKWFESFAKRHGVILNEHADVVAGDIPDPIDSTHEISAATRGYRAEDVYAMDEICISYEMSPESSSDAPCVWRQKKQRLITAVLCTNAAGSDRLLPLFVCQRLPTSGGLTDGVTQKDSTRGDNISQPSPDLVYVANQKAWFTASMFRTWLSAFDGRMREQQRQVLLLIDAAATHNFSCLSLTNVKVLLTSMRRPDLQPLAGEASTSIRRRYRLQHYQYVLTKNPNIVDYEVPVFLVMEWLCRYWSELPLGTIVSAFRGAGVAAPLQFDLDAGQEREIDARILECVTLLKCTAPMGLAQMLCPWHEQHAQNIEKMTDNNIVESVVEENELPVATETTEPSRNSGGDESSRKAEWASNPSKVEITQNIDYEMAYV